MRLEGKVAVITGAGSGMGRAMATLFAREGAKVVAGDWNETTLNEAVEEIRAAGGEIVGQKVDISSREQAEGLIDLAVSTYGRLDILCNNAGIMDRNHGVGEVTDEMWERVIGVNLNGPMYTSRRAIPIMLEQGGGSIVNVGSTAALSGAAAGAAYTASKHALLGLTRSTAWIYAQRAIRCNLIAPGATRTNIVSQQQMAEFDPEGSARTGVFTNTVPALLEAMDIANVALFLASDESKNINGAVIAADGGWLAT